MTKPGRCTRYIPRLADPGVISARHDENGNPLLNSQGKPYKHKTVHGGCYGKSTRSLTSEMPCGVYPHNSNQWPSYQATRPGNPSQEKGKRDLWYLCSRVLHRVYPDLVESLHRPWCEFFVQKNPTKDVLVQDMVKNRLLLAPRGHFKTTINLCDIIQWMLAFPDITICLFSGTEPLAARMVDEIK